MSATGQWELGRLARWARIVLDHRKHMAKEKKEMAWRPMRARIHAHRLGPHNGARNAAMQSERL